MLECGKYNHIINWLPDGASFSILDEALLVRDVLPFYCPGARYETFIRQLNQYGMETLKKRKQADIGRMFSSALFIRGRKDLLLTMQRTGAKPSSNAKTEVAPSGPNKRNKVDNDSPPDKSSITGSYSGPLFPNLRSFRRHIQSASEVAQTEAAAVSHTSTNGAGLWLAQKVVVTRVTEHVKYAFIPHDLLSELLHSSALQAAVTNCMCSSEQLHSRDVGFISSSFNGYQAYESSTILESRFSPVEYAIASAGFEGSFPAASIQSAAPGSARQQLAADWPQQMLQALGVSNEAIIVADHTTLDSAVADITAAPAALTSSEQEEGEGQAGTP